jgi:ComF family protein
MLSVGKVRVCETCVGRVGEMDEALCSRCGDAMGMREAFGYEDARFAAAMGVSECSMCRLAPPEFNRAVAFANYDNEMREMLHLLKFAGRRQMAEFVLGERLAKAVLKLEASFERVPTSGKTQIPCGNDKQRGTAIELAVIPVPLFAARERERGFNQAMLLARAAVKALKRLRPEWKLWVEDGALRRVKDTRSLYLLNPSQRRKNLVGAFRVDKAAVAKIAGREVLLIDDIMTTGATARECAKVLRRAGAAKVWVATAAKAQPGSVKGLAQSVPGDVAMWSTPAKLVEPDVGRQVQF